MNEKEDWEKIAKELLAFLQRKQRVWWHRSQVKNEKVYCGWGNNQLGSSVK